MGLFDELAKIEAREEKLVPKSDLDTIFTAEEEIIKEHKTDKMFEEYSQRHSEAYSLLKGSTQEKIADIKLTSEMLQEYISARENIEKDTVAIIRGMYSAALLELICKKNSNIKIYINGKGKTFNFLFYYINHVRNLTLKNISGNKVLYHAGSWNGSCEHLSLSGIKGEQILERAGSWNGSAKRIVINNIYGNRLLCYAGAHGGSIKHITVQNVEGNNTLTEVALGEGSAKYLTLKRIKGDYTLKNAHINVSTKYILRENNSDKRQKEIFSQIEKIADIIHTLPFEEQKTAYDEIARLQKEIFSEET